MKLTFHPGNRVTVQVSKLNLTMSTSGLVTITLFAILMIWDGYSVYFGGGTQSSVSQWIIAWFGFNPVPFYAGTLVGHLACNMWPDFAPLQQAWTQYKSDPSEANMAAVDAALAQVSNQGPLRYFARILKLF